MAETTEFLGQDLYRQALKESSLEVFEAPAAVMEDEQIAIIDRADAFKALRHGLAGIAIHGWQDEITAGLAKPLYLGDHGIAYRFDDDAHLPPHRHAVYRHAELDIPGGHVILTQGEFALQTLKSGLAVSANAYFSNLDNEIEGIPMASLHHAIHRYVMMGRHSRLTSVPDAIKRQVADLGDFYDGDSDVPFGEVNPEVPVAKSLADSAANNVRFSEVPIFFGMSHYAGLYPQRVHPGEWRPLPAQDQFDALDYDPAAAAAMLVQNVRFPVRMSQRQQGTNNLVDKDAPKGKPGVLSVASDGNGNDEVMWQRKYDRPGRHSDVGLHVAADGDIDIDWPNVDLTKMTLVQKRNKCPIGYTKEAGDTMPGLKIADGILHHLLQGGLHDPRYFMSPREILVAVDY